MCPAATAMATAPQSPKPEVQSAYRSGRPKTARGRRRRAVSDDLDDPVTPPANESGHSDEEEEEEDVFDEDMATSPPLLPGHCIRRTSVQSCTSRLQQQPSLSGNPFRRSAADHAQGDTSDLLTYEDLQRATGMKVLSKLMDRQRSLQGVRLPCSGKKKANGQVDEVKPTSAAILSSANSVQAGKGKQPPRRLKPMESRRVYSE